MNSSNNKIELLSKKVDDLIDKRHTFESSIDFSYRLSELFNHEIIKIAGESIPGLAIGAFGGFGRMELSPYSDIDLCFIIHKPDETSEYIGNLVRKLWDRGIQISHTVRDFGQITEIAANDLQSFTQLLELRFVTGNKSVYLRFIERLLGAINSELKIKILQNLLSDIERRHLTYGTSPLLLEPNIKHSAGGMRDLHSAAWIYIILNNLHPEAELFDSSTNDFLNEIVKQKVISSKKRSEIFTAYETLLKIRNELHVLNQFKRDKLDFQNQILIANNLLGDSIDSSNGHIRLMQDYFISSEAISNLLRNFTKKALLKIFPLSDYSVYELNEKFILHGRFIQQKTNDALKLDEILELYYFRTKFSALFSEELEENIIHSISYFDGTEIENVEVSKIFKKILQYPENVYEVLLHMNRIGILGFVIPEFENLRRFFQPNAYHIYTADEHTILAIKNLSKISIDNSMLGVIYRSYDNIELLYLAVLFHDIAKPHNLAGHEILGAQFAETIMQRLGYDDEEIRIVSFLVTNHLLMEQTAFRRNLSDAAILNSFRDKFKSLKELDFLFLLTYADLSAVNPSSWSNWKNSLLQELYLKTKQMILSELSGEDILTSNVRKIDFHKFEMKETDFLEHLDQISDDRYLFTFSDKEIATHISEIQNGDEISITYKEDEEFTYLTVITKDCHGLLSKICGAIAISDANIHDANIFTRKDHIAIDTFKLTDFSSHKPLNEKQKDLLSKNITIVLLNDSDLQSKFDEHRNKWRRIEKKIQLKKEVEISFENHPVYTIIDIHTSDRIGLLYLITKRFAELGLEIYFAKIGTKLNGVFDSFYVLDINQQKISSSKYKFYMDSLRETLTQF
ncbi:MAG: HD domain-containing protein [Ignavibacteria bacterium]|nr:HD domain-containing protein [Ignavibacteria bacterium]